MPRYSIAMLESKKETEEVLLLKRKEVDKADQMLNQKFNISNSEFTAKIDEAKLFDNK